MNMTRDLPFLKQIAKTMAAQFGNNCEVVVHDLGHSLENTIVAIENGHVSGRQIGDGGSSAVLMAMQRKNKQEDKLNYQIKTKDGRVLKASTIYIRDDDNEKVVGLFSINYDVTEMIVSANVIQEFIRCQESEKPQQMAGDVNSLLDELIEESYQHIGKPVAAMTKEDKIKAMQYLDSRGAFLIKKAGDKISKFYDISKYTLYNYLGSA